MAAPAVTFWRANHHRQVSTNLPHRPWHPTGPSQWLFEHTSVGYWKACPMLLHVCFQRCYTCFSGCGLWIGRVCEAAVFWPARSPDLNALDIFCGNVWKSGSMLLQMIVEKNCGVEFNNLQVRYWIHSWPWNSCEFLFHQELKRVTVSMETIWSAY
jgi:hypothetical protein